MEEFKEFFSGFIDEDFDIFTIRLVIALFLSGLIGFERELKRHSAGFRTHILVGVGACIMMLLSLYGFEEYIQKYDNIRFDPARIPSYVISGIGFLGAGTIIVNGSTIRGLTTAASIWTVAGIGLIVGAGMYDIAVLATFLVLLSLILLNNLEEKYLRHVAKGAYHLTVADQKGVKEIFALLEHLEVEIEKVEIKKEDHIYMILKLSKTNTLDDQTLMEELGKLDGEISVIHRF
ncbi:MULTISPECIES: MgtC/SapB family protein [Salimicrobium]|uniref:ATPase n=4 Tax=Salimicrobium TaxID=351195 RepID=K2G7K4_9BACI|nr:MULTISPECIES: MgtC/SapB family protein [Salimicrobium]AKG05626.1 ATPase [Salimicrobium jeotgali]EKE30377.1 magnesium MgtC family transporter [Salimicrobium jeotgali]MBM7696521.1 putative Mg2+ transporter-C (MgtC) family protein [Salimicrobium jeotgali]PBB05277.1 ATPase [Salimicrobium humidisoli]SDY23931.1 putative Mg2+ transporter-C (MgtC) family protein [Salimicrobium album]